MPKRRSCRHREKLHVGDRYEVGVPLQQSVLFGADADARTALADRGNWVARDYRVQKMDGLRNESALQDAEQSM